MVQRALRVRRQPRNAHAQASVPRMSGILALLQQWMVACNPILAAQPARCAARIRAALASLAKQARCAREEKAKAKAKTARLRLAARFARRKAKAKTRTVRSFVAHSSLALVKRNSNGKATDKSRSARLRLRVTLRSTLRNCSLT